MYQRYRRHFLSILIIAAVSILVLWAFYSPRILQDDWQQIVFDHIFNLQTWFDWKNRRPLFLAAFKAISALFGLNMAAFYLVNYLVILGISIMVYGILERLCARYFPLSLLAALLALVYPADFTLSWVTMINNRLAWLLALLGIWFLLEFERHNQTRALLLAGVLFTIPLFLYDGALGQELAAWGLLWLYRLKTGPGRKRLLLLIPGFCLLLYTIYRVAIRPALGVIDMHVGSLSLFELGTLAQPFRELKIFGWAWVEPSRILMSYLNLPPLPGWPTLILVAAAISTAVLIVRLVPRRRAITTVEGFQPGEKRDLVTRLSTLTAISLLLMLTGYFPSILIYPPNLDDISTRVNMYSIPAVSAGILGGIGIAAALGSSNLRTWKNMVTAGAIPLLLIGTISQVSIRHARHNAWLQQKSIFQQMFSIAPAFRDDTTVLLVMTGFESLGYAEKPPVYAEWEFDYALQSLYENQSLRGRILFPDADFFSEGHISPEGVYNSRYNTLANYESVVILHYDQSNQVLELVERPRLVFSERYGFSEYDPGTLIQADTGRIWRYRYLVEN